MTLVDIRIPQLGEGLQEALVLALLKTPGSQVDKDEPVFEMETDKARVSVEAACAGMLREWLVREGDVVAIGAVIGRIEPVDTGFRETAHQGYDAAAPESSGGSQNDARTASAGPSVRIPPRTRAHARILGLSEEDLHRIRSRSGKLMPVDLDQYVAERAKHGATDGRDTHRERRLSAQQRALTFRFRRSAQLVIPATIMCPLAWTSVERALQAARTAHPDVPIGVLEVIAYAVAQAAGAHPNFRSTLLGDDRLREYPHLTLGIAVHRPDGDLVTAAVPRADTKALPEIARGVQVAVASAMEGLDPTNETTQIVMTYLGTNTVTHAVPTLVAPAIATVFVGAPFESVVGMTTSLCLTFEHRLINGSEAADFLRTVVCEVDRLGKSANVVNTDRSCDQTPRSAAQETADVIDLGPDRDRVGRVTALVHDRVASLLEAPLTAADVRLPLRSLGMTSVMAVALSKALERDLGRAVSATLVWNFPTIDAIARHLAANLDLHAESSAAADLAPDDEQKLERLLTEVEGLSESEATLLLNSAEKRDEPQSR